METGSISPYKCLFVTSGIRAEHTPYTHLCRSFTPTHAHAHSHTHGFKCWGPFYLGGVHKIVKRRRVMWNNEYASVHQGRKRRQEDRCCQRSTGARVSGSSAVVEEHSSVWAVDSSSVLWWVITVFPACLQPTPYPCSERPDREAHANSWRRTDSTQRNPTNQSLQWQDQVPFQTFCVPNLKIKKGKKEK